MHHRMGKQPLVPVVSLDSSLRDKARRDVVAHLGPALL